MPKIYLAGPDVFLPNSIEVLSAKAAIVTEAGFEPVIPGDIAVQPNPDRRAWGLAISDVDRQMMLDSDIILANLTPFRGISADVGTAFELGFMCSLGREAHGYTNVISSYFERTRRYYDDRTEARFDGAMQGSDGLLMEDFGLADNLMIDGGIAARGGYFVREAAESADIVGSLAAFRKCMSLVAASHQKKR